MQNLRLGVHASAIGKSASSLRLQGLDFLRDMAIILVLLHHHPAFPPLLPGFGWIGVDLFFTLSGFLVAGLLFSDFANRGAIDVPFFVFRRALKILPSFLFLIFATIFIEAAKSWITQTPWGISPQRIGSELFFLQSYCGGLFVHTWSLAVEVHFYVLLLLVVYAGLRWFPKAFFAYYPACIAVIAASCLLLRVYTNARYTFDFWSMVTPTHLRIDGLWLGSLIAYYYYFHKKLFIRIVNKYAFLIAILTAIAFAIFIVHQTNTIFTHTFGLTLLSVGFCGIVVLTLCGESKGSAAKRGFVQGTTKSVRCIGVHS